MIAPPRSSESLVIEAGQRRSGDDTFQCRIDGTPFVQQLREDCLAFAREAIEALVALVLLPPDTLQQPLRLQPPQQRIERVLFNVHALVSQGFAQLVAVVLRP